MKHTGIRKGPVRILGPQTEKKYLSLRNTNETGVPATAPPCMVYQDEVISGSNIIIQKKVLNRKCLTLLNRKPRLRGSTNLHLVAATLKSSVVITN